MTSLAFMLGVVPLAIATGAGATSQRHRHGCAGRHVERNAARRAVRAGVLRLGHVPVQPKKTDNYQELPATTEEKPSEINDHHHAPLSVAPACSKRDRANRVFDGTRLRTRPFPRHGARLESCGDNAQPSSAASLDWQTFVADGSLRKLVELALSNNLDLRQTLLNVRPLARSTACSGLIACPALMRKAAAAASAAGGPQPFRSGRRAEHVAGRRRNGGFRAGSVRPGAQPVTGGARRVFGDGRRRPCGMSASWVKSSGLPDAPRRAAALRADGTDGRGRLR